MVIIFDIDLLLGYNYERFLLSSNVFSFFLIPIPKYYDIKNISSIKLILILNYIKLS